MMANGVYAMSAITALTAQNTMGVKSILEATPEFLQDQLDCIFTDIRPDAVKIGMVSSAGLIRVIAAKLKEYKAEHITDHDNSELIADLPDARQITLRRNDNSVGSGDGFHQRFPADCPGSGEGAERGADSNGGHPHPEYSGSTGTGGLQH